MIPGPGRKEQASRDALAGSAKAIEILARAAGERHLFLCLHADAPLTPRKAEDLERRASEEKIVLHGILPNGPEDATELVRICRESGGTFSRIPEDQIAFAMAAIFRGFLKRYEIVWWPPDATGAARCVRLQIFSLGGCADCTIDLEQTAP